MQMNKHETRVGKTESIFKAFENHHHQSKLKQSSRAPLKYIKAQLFCLKNQMTVELESRRKQNMHQHIYPQSRNILLHMSFFQSFAKTKTL